jgi:serine/threonine protein kinase
LRNLCPTCHRRFEEPGFCPFDGAALTPGAAADQRTLVEARRTFPLTPSPSPPPSTPPSTPKPPADPGDITSAPTRPSPVRPGAPRGLAGAEPPKLRSKSASENPSEALELYREPRDNQYDQLIGQTLDGRYYVEKKIGEGGMGVVFSARHAVIERPLAIKVLKRDAMRDTATIRRFVQEAQAASRIGHPNIVDVTDFGTTPDGMTYSVMEFVAGQTLGTAIRNGAPFAPPRAIRITAQIARALAAAHDKGIVHRDLKPENVFLLDRDGRQDFVKIVDFGIAKVTPRSDKPAEPRLTRAGSVFGTPEYMAPEQAAGRGDTDGRVDVYALGVILYEMLCARVPHRGDSMVRTLAMQMLDPIEPPSKVRPDLAIAPDLEAIVMHALAKKREQRCQTMSELLAALEAILPPAVGVSVTGSPLYTLAALPPGADPGVVPSQPARPVQSSEPRSPPSHPATQPGVEPARPSGSTRRIKDEPEFTADDRPRSFQHVFTEELVPARARRWPLLLLFAMIAGGAVGATALVLKSRGAVIDHARDAGLIAAVGDTGADPAPADAPADAVELIAFPELDAGRLVRPARPHDAGLTVSAVPAVPVAPVVPETPNHRGTVLVQVLTRPEGANLYDGTHYRGPGGTELEEPLDHKLVITCRLPGYKPGSVEVHFTRDATAVLCVLQRIKICIDGIKNPFDDCEIDPANEPSRPTPHDPGSLMNPSAPSKPPQP